ncbi:MAG TPA: PhzF family phenazine biosynthesis protein [Candidatus Sulfotelmatobacter sp.]|nr:PhzF family phenazine biosynthesis protein [Candidatus Sulfotelmatobacter sp.]
MRIPLYQVDAFTNQPFAGNPAGVCPLSVWLDDEGLRKVAAENNLSATAFFVPRDTPLEIRWFTPRCEIRLCGHATLASAYVVLNILETGREAVTFETRFSGSLTVRKEGEILAMDFPAMLPKICADPPEDLFRALGPGPAPSKILEANSTYIAVYEAENSIRRIRPDFTRLEQLHPFAVAVTAPGEHADFVSRYFAPSYGVAEDPATGSLLCSLTPYWTERLGKTNLHARQLSERGGEFWCEVTDERVIIKGNAVLTMEGSLRI